MTTLIVGATGNLGGYVARQLLAKGLPVRALTRDPARASALQAAGAEIVRGDLRDISSLRAATGGVRAVVSAAHSMLGTGSNSSTLVDHDGQRALIHAAKDGGVEHFVFTSVIGAAASHPVDFWRTKDRIERCLESSGIAYTIIRPTAFMEIHAYDLVGKAVEQGKRVALFGPGRNPRNFVAAADVARLVVLALEDARLRGQIIEIGGPENLTSRQVVAIFETATGRPAKTMHVPLPVLRVFSRLLAPVHSGVSRILSAAVVGETTDQRFDSAVLLARYPIELTRLEDWARSKCSSRRGPESRPHPPEPVA